MSWFGQEVDRGALRVLDGILDGRLEAVAEVEDDVRRR